MNINNAIGLSEARLLLVTSNGHHPSADTMRRWADSTRGCRPAGRKGPLVVLQAVNHQGALVTTAEWLEEFKRECAAAVAKRAETPIRFLQLLARPAASDDELADALEEVRRSPN